MSDETQSLFSGPGASTPAEVRAPAAAPPVAEATPQDVAETPVESPAAGPLPTEIEGQADHELNLAENAIDARRREIDVAPLSTDRVTVGLRQSDTVTVIAPKIADEGVRQEQIHTNL
jgi:hypothetical protein